MGSEQREYPRHPVFGGNAEVTAVFGRGRQPEGRARVMNWSRGGILLRVPSRRRRFIIKRLDPAVYQEDVIACTLRLPPQYGEFHVRGRVVHVARAKDDPDQLDVGLSFDAESTPTRTLEQLAKLLEPKPRSNSCRMPKASSGSQRVRSASGRSKRLKSGGQAASGTSTRTSRRSQRVEKISQRLGAAAPERESNETDRLPLDAAPKKGSGRARVATQRLKKPS